LKSNAFEALRPAARGVMFAGLLLLMLTPFLRVFTAIVGFAAEKDRTFVLVALVVFVMLLGELVFSL
jgi:uncharacterized membrane protein